MGPFIDSNHPMIKAGQVEMLPNDLFCDKISRQLAKLLKESPTTTVILIPNARDLISQHITYPQSPFNREAELRLPKVRPSFFIVASREAEIRRFNRE